ncbi:nucleolar protein 11-like isoform X2 [Penaeus chinensis]|uniref:nucleolar protein 11-like isoform X2 n=1 Tax=Penaeus chinensis TaxID=139456 RepID=UPI001FB6E775|nr:nucleolar protein 11-like isoform X2 [Penaeus chinensis]
MASSLHNTSFLCSDFHVRNLLGVSVDADEHILITCKGVVKLYNVLDRRQVRSWSTKSWHPFTSAAVTVPATNNLAVVINGNSISQWSREEDDIDNVKRYNFESPIHQLLVSGDKVYTVFTNGEIEELQSALSTRRETKPGFLQEGEIITYVQIIESTSTALIAAKRKEASCTKLYELQLNQSGGRSPRGYDLAVADCTLTGLCALSSSILITLWSSGDMYSFDLRNDSLEKLPGKKHATETSVIPSKSTKILELSPSHIAIIGMGKGDEGGLIVLRDLPFAMTVCCRKLKMYHDPPLAWVTPDGIVVAEGGSLALIPYTVKESNLATVFGTKASEDCEYTSEVCRSWNLGTEEAVPVEAQETIYTNKSTELTHIMRDLKKDTLTESLLVTHLVDILLEKKKTRLLNETLDTFRDIPEACLVNIANYYLSCDNADFEGLCKCPQMETKCVIPGDEPEEVTCPFGLAKAHFINGLLRKPFTDILLSPELYRLGFDNALSLIQYLHFLLAAGEALLVPEESSRMPSVAQASSWLSLLLDTKYQHLVMTSQVDIHRLLLSCFTQVNNLRVFLEGLMDMEPLVKRVVEAKVLPPQMNSSSYSLERLTIT